MDTSEPPPGNPTHTNEKPSQDQNSPKSDRVTRSTKKNDDLKPEDIFSDDSEAEYDQKVEENLLEQSTNGDNKAEEWVKNQTTTTCKQQGVKEKVLYTFKTIKYKSIN